jgi:hypothetical protein
MKDSEMKSDGFHQERTLAKASHSHLFPGAIVRLDINVLNVGGPEPLGLVIRFIDGIEARAELLIVGPESSLVMALDVEGYTTAAGSTIPAKTWGMTKQPAVEGAVVLRVTRRELSWY